MKKKIIITMVALMVMLSNTVTAFASPQKPFDWEGNLDSNTLGFNKNTAVEMKNGDGTDVKTVSGRYIAKNSIKQDNGTPLYPIGGPNAHKGFSFPNNVDSVSCQVVKEDAYLIMPFDGFVSIGICDEELSGESEKICIRAKAGDKVNLVPRNLVYTYTTNDVYGDYNSSYFKKIYGKTTADNWTYNLRIYKEVIIPIEGRKFSNKADKKYAAKAIDYANYYSCLWYLYQVDAPKTELKAKKVSRDDIENYNKYNSYRKENSFTGWLENPEVKGSWKYIKDGITVEFDAYLDNKENPYDGNSFYLPEEYKEIITVNDGDIFIDGYKVNSKNFHRMDDKYNIVNAQ